MKIAIIGAAGLRTPLILKSILARQNALNLQELTLMDIDGERLELVGALTQSFEESIKSSVTIRRTTDPKIALTDADFVITTFRVGGIESRVIDERVPLSHGIIGQETTGPGGFAMGIRSIPVILDYVKLISKCCPNAWLINFANPAGMLTEAVVRYTSLTRVVGICDAPSSMHRVISALLKSKPEDVYLDYFGLNHLGWIKQVICQNRDHLHDLINLIRESGSVPGLPFDPQLIIDLELIPNEYLYYYYYAKQSVNNILKSEKCRGEQITRFNVDLLKTLGEKFKYKDLHGMEADYEAYLNMRGETYMLSETGRKQDLSILKSEVINSIMDEGYAGVALNLIEALSSEKSGIHILNIPNQGAIHGLGDLDVVEIPAFVNRDHIQPIAIGDIPAHCLGLMMQVKKYERLTIEAAIKKSYYKALLALTIHPLVQDYSTAKVVLNDYIRQHRGYFPDLN